MRRRFDVSQALDHIFADNKAKDTQQHRDTDEQVSEERDDVEYQPEDTDTSDQSDEEVTGAEAAPAPAETFKSKSCNICWSSVPPDIHGRAAAANVIKMTLGITRFAVTRASDIKTSFNLFKPLSLIKFIIAMTNLEGKKVDGNMWNDIDEEYLDAYIVFFLLEGVYRSGNEATDFWDVLTVSLQTFQILRFDNIPITDVWERWAQLLPLMFNPGPEVPVDEHFLPFHGNCPFRQYMPSKSGKYDIKIPEKKKKTRKTSSPRYDYWTAGS